MITSYHRPQTLDEALELLAQPDTIALGGGTLINTPQFTNSQPADFTVVDLQALGLNKIHKSGNSLEIGATVTLQQLLESVHAPEALKQAIRQESALNIRNAATVAGTLVTCDGRSPFGTAMLAMDAGLTVDGGRWTVDRGQKTEDGLLSTVYGLSDVLALRSDLLPHKLITKISIPLNAKIAFEMVARSPADRPIMCVAVAHWNAGRARLALGGWGRSPLLGMDGTEPSGIEAAARNACHDAKDEWASAEYRMDVAATLAKRCLERAQE